MCWDGPDPHAGDYLAGRQAGQLWRIQEVTPIAKRAAGDDARLMLTLEAVALDGVPRGVRIHPWVRTAASHPSGPPRARQTAPGGEVGAVMRGAWPDPSAAFLGPARVAPQISGWRTYCPLRRMLGGRGSQIEERHIIAADYLRQQVDAALIGYSGMASLELRPQAYGPSDGPSAAALAQACSGREVTRALRQFTPAHCAMLVFVVLRNRSLQAWCTEQARVDGEPLNAQVEMGKLLVILDLLAKYYETEIKAALDSNRILGAA